MIKVIKLEEYIEAANSIIRLKGFRQCPICKKITAPILRYNDDDYFYIENIKD